MICKTHVWKNEHASQLFNKTLSNAFNVIELKENDEREKRRLEVDSKK